MFFELSDGHQAIHRVSGEAADGFGHDEVNLPSQGIRHHGVEAVTLFCVDGRDALVRVDLYKLPFRLRPDILGVIVYLGLVAGELLLAVCGDTGISMDTGDTSTFVPAIAMTDAADAAMPSIFTVTSPL